MIKMITALTVDDCGVARDFLKIMIETLDIEIIGEALSGKEGVEMYKKLEPDIVFMDIKMDGMSGFEALAQIMELDPDAKVIITSSLADQKIIIDEAKRRGAKAFLAKPLEINNVRAAVHEAMTAD